MPRRWWEPVDVEHFQGQNLPDAQAQAVISPARTIRVAQLAAPYLIMPLHFLASFGISRQAYELRVDG